MSESNHQNLINRILENISAPMISSDTGMEAARKIGKLAAQEEIEWAIAGGLAMYIFGSDRLTKDVDIIASQNLSLTPDHPLGFGGSSYTLQVGKYAVQIDWIVRSDGYKKYYTAALRDAVKMPNGLRVITPEWMVILKINAGRQKDLNDAVFLLKQQKLVDRPKVKRKLISVGGEDAWLIMMPNFRRLCDLADGNTNESDKYYDQD